MNLATLSIAELTRLLTKSELSAREIALHTLAAISQHNPALNAWTHITQDRMLQEADRIDRLKQDNQPLPRWQRCLTPSKICLMWPGTRRWPGPVCLAIVRRRTRMPGRCRSWPPAAHCCPVC